MCCRLPKFARISAAPYQSQESLASANKALSETEHHMEVGICLLSFVTRSFTNIQQQEWARTLPDHLRFSDESLDVQQSMFETSSNIGAWFWCCHHVYYAACALAINFVSPPSDYSVSMFEFGLR